MDDYIEKKHLIRKEMKNLRNTMDSHEMFVKSSQILEQLVMKPQYMKADKIYTYVSSNNEVDTIMLIDVSLSNNKRVFVPKVVGNDILFYEISDISELSPGYMGIFEPSIDGKDPDYSKTGLICVPGLAFDKNKNRLGYGGGFFDRFFAQPNNLYKVGLAYDYQIIDSVPCDDNDIKMNMIITETEWF